MLRVSVERCLESGSVHANTKVQYTYTTHTGKYHNKQGLRSPSYKPLTKAVHTWQNKVAVHVDIKRKIRRAHFVLDPSIHCKMIEKRVQLLSSMHSLYLKPYIGSRFCKAPLIHFVSSHSTTIQNWAVEHRSNTSHGDTTNSYKHFVTPNSVYLLPTTGSLLPKQRAI